VGQREKVRADIFADGAMRESESRLIACGAKKESCCEAVENCL